MKKTILKKGDWLLDEDLEWNQFISHTQNGKYINIRDVHGVEFEYQSPEEFTKPKPIIFSTDMVRALLDGTKTQTRRLIKPQPIVQEGQVIHEVATNDFWVGILNSHFSGYSSTRFSCPYQPGDILYVRETFLLRPKHEKYYYKADYPNYEPYAHNGWKPSIHMPAAAARIFLKVEEVRVERLQDISEGDAIAEGVGRWPDGHFKAYGPDAGKYTFATDSFRTLWDSINKDRADWRSNPWLWAISFSSIR